MIETGAWSRNAAHGNACATRLASQIAGVTGVELMFPVEANAVFILGPDALFTRLRARGWQFYTFIGGGARFMFAWDADVSRVDALAQDIRVSAADVAPPSADAGLRAIGA
jgi:threonine aldolase